MHTLSYSSVILRHHRMSDSRALWAVVAPLRTPPFTTVRFPEHPPPCNDVTAAGLTADGFLMYCRLTLLPPLFELE